MDLNVKTDATVLQVQMDSGVSLNLQVPKPIEMTVTGVVYGGGGGSSELLEEFFGVYQDGDKVMVQGLDPEHPEQIVPAEFMTDTEVTDELEDIMQALDPELEQEVEYPEGSGTYITKAQAITAEAMQIINPSQS